MLQALNRGVSEERIAAALNVDVYAVRQKSQMLDGICDEVVELLCDRKMSPELFRILRKMKPEIQILPRIRLISPLYLCGFGAQKFA